MEELVCSGCKRVTVKVTDYGCGDTICTECGLVVQSDFINDSDSVDAPTNPFLKSGGLTTVIVEPKEKVSSVSNDYFTTLCRIQKLVNNNPEEDLIKKACKKIKRMTDALVLNKVINFRACEIMSKLDGNDGNRLCRGKHFNALCAASVFMACRELQFPRTLKEISTVAKGVELKDISKASMEIQRLLASEQAVAAPAPPPQLIINTGEIVRRFCSELYISEREMRAIREAFKEAENFDMWRNPKAVLAAVIFMISQLSRTKKRPIREIGIVLEVVENTIKNCVKDMYPYALKIIPKWYACEEDIIKRLATIINSWDPAKRIEEAST